MPDITTLFEATDGVSRALFNQKLSDVNKHGNDGAVHVTDAERGKWNDGIVGIYTHTKTGAVHDFSGAGSNGKAHITADFVVGDTFTVNGQPVASKLQNGEQPTDEFFKAGCWVQFIYDSDTNQLNFSAGGSKQIPTTYAGKLTVSVSAYDGGSLANTKVRIQNSSIGMDLTYTPDALGKVTLELTGNKTYSATLIDVPEPYYGEAATIHVAFDSDNALALQLKDQPDVIGWETKLQSGVNNSIVYIDGAKDFIPITYDSENGVDLGYFIHSWLLESFRPCMLKNGIVQYYFKRLNNHTFDYTKQENGSPANTDGTDGDLMIEISQFYTAFNVEQRM